MLYVSIGIAFVCLLYFMSAYDDLARVVERRDPEEWELVGKPSTFGGAAKGKFIDSISRGHASLRWVYYTPEGLEGHAPSLRVLRKYRIVWCLMAASGMWALGCMIFT
ncbi:hypothetical protein [Verrucomicrobium sp. BvORR106]|uniref:hypothetical protein n=1 Tax=Verrucomicrobium sp. BvORR106 TaxID=1403819 RepID=UPI0005716B28|nr:hypothetical protein [Verrucomicrobium sp. BvORR106]